MFSTIIIDSDLDSANHLAELLRRFCFDRMDLLAVYHTINDAIQGIEQSNPELVFINQKIGESTAFQLLERIPEIAFKIIFTCSSDTFSRNSIKYNAVDYLVKPVIAEDVITALLRAELMKLKEREIELWDETNNGNRGNKRLCIPTNKGFKVVLISDIVRCQSDGNYTSIILNNQEKIMVSKTLKIFENILSHHQFFRIHHSHLINLHYVKEYIRDKGGYVILTDNSEIKVSMRRTDNFIDALNKY